MEYCNWDLFLLLLELTERCLCVSKMCSSLNLMNHVVVVLNRKSLHGFLHHALSVPDFQIKLLLLYLFLKLLLIFNVRTKISIIAAYQLDYVFLFSIFETYCPGLFPVISITVYPCWKSGMECTTSSHSFFPTNVYSFVFDVIRWAF